MTVDDDVETETPVFTEEEVFMVAGFLAERWGVEGDHSDEIDEAIATVLRRPKAWVCSCNGWLDGVVLPPKTDCPDCHGTGRRETPVAPEEWLPRGHPENPESPENRAAAEAESERAWSYEHAVMKEHDLDA